MRERRQATGFIGGPETEIKNVPENQSCPQDVPLPNELCETSRVCVAGQGF